ncbi:MAG: Bax inhibitor-1/YccA family protein [Endomicrobium sp.]|jgi:uncharacterized YccA/Bax inhibitor family protein|nr:Bax inhibitor-1/YccA family protein [Endomicrobium sp.]
MVFAFASALYSWTHPQVVMPLMWPLLIGGLALALISIFKKTASPFLSPLYAVAEGLLMGVISLSFEKQYPGIVVNAVFLTAAVLFCMLAAYKSGLLRATPLFTKVVVLSTLAIAAVYILDIAVNVFAGANVPYLHDTSLLGVGISLVITAVAALNLILDFNLIERGAYEGAPKYMEWYCSFALMVTLVWLYLEILRLLAKIRN